MIETVKVKRDGKKGFHVINKTDFVEGVHELYEAKPAAPAPKKGRK
jgi:hypothetical protein